jgi:diguanylate cyclase (GGDEF)-like protein
MTNAVAPYVIVLIAASGVSAGMAAAAWRRRRIPVALPFTGLLACTALYSFGYALELASGSLPGMLFWNRIQYLGISFIPAFWMILAIRYTGRDFPLLRPLVAGLFVLSALTLLLDLTSPLHHFFYRSVGVSGDGPFPVIVLEKGFWYWIHVAYINLSLLSGNALLFRAFRKSVAPYRDQVAFMMAGSALPWLGFLLYLLGLGPRGLDLTPFAFALAGPFIAWGTFRFRILNLVPVARESVFESLSDGAVILDNQDRIIDFNPAAALVLRKLERRSIGRPLGEVLQGHREILELFSVAGPQAATIRVGEGDSRRSFRAKTSPIFGRKNRLLGRSLILHDTTEQVRMTEKLRIFATIDDLTGAFNRRYFMELGGKEISRARRYGRALSLVILDLDHFKRINDTWGHESGDCVLKATGKAIRGILRETDHFGRLGGEEFAILLPETPLDSARFVAERLRLVIESNRVRVSKGEDVGITASIGVAGLEEVGDERLDDLIRAADLAMYKAKDAGRDRIMVWESAVHPPRPSDRPESEERKG